MSNATDVAAFTTINRPFKFLNYYSEKDSSVFAGREKDITEVVARVSQGRSTILYGRSGLGKTSLLLAGVFPELRRRKLHPVYTRILEDPLQDLSSALASEFHAVCKPEKAELLDYFRTKAACEGVVLTLDQFEEFFIRFRERPADLHRFIGLLSELLSDKTIDVRLLFSIREDYLAELDEFREALGSFPNEYRLRPLNAFGARQAIAKPLLEAGVNYDQRLLTRLVDLLAEVDFDSVVLQITASEVYREAEKRPERPIYLGESDLDRVGGLEGIFRRYLDAATAQLPRDRILLSRTVLDALITSDRTKRAVTLSTLVDGQIVADPREIERVLEDLQKQWLIRKELRGSRLWYELTHERLVPSILDWFKLDKAFTEFREARDFIASASRSDFRNRLDILPTKEAIEQWVSPFRDRLRLSDLQSEFMFYCAVYRQLADASHWINAFGADEGRRQLLCVFVVHSNPMARSGAARAAALLSDPDQELERECIRLTLEDDNHQVRRSAGCALGTLATFGGMQLLKERLNDKAVRSRALETLADIFQVRKAVPRLGWRWRRKIRRIAATRILRDTSHVIEAQTKAATRAGITTAFVWVFTLGVGGVFSFALSYVASDSEIYAAITTFIVLGAIAVGSGALIGWRLGRRAAVDAQLSGAGRWFLVIVRSWLPVVAVVLVLLTVGLLRATTSVRFSLSLLTLGWFASVAAFGTFMIQILVACQVRVSRVGVWPEVSNNRTIFWSLSGAFAFPFVIAVSVITTLHYHHFQWADPDASILLPGVVALIFSLVVSISTVVLTKVPPLASDQLDRNRMRRKRKLFRFAAGVLGISVIVWYFATFGFDPINSIRRTVRLDETSCQDKPCSITSTFGPWPTVRRFFIVGRQDHGQRYTLSDIHVPTSLAYAPLGLVLGGRSVSINEGSVGQVLFVPPGIHLASLGRSSYRDFSGTVGLELSRVLEMRPGMEVILRPGNWTPAQLTFDKKSLDNTGTNIKIFNFKIKGANAVTPALIRLRPLRDAQVFLPLAPAEPLIINCPKSDADRTLSLVQSGDEEQKFGSYSYEPLPTTTVRTKADGSFTLAFQFRCEAFTALSPTIPRLRTIPVKPPLQASSGLTSFSLGLALEAEVDGQDSSKQEEIMGHIGGKSNASPEDLGKAALDLLGEGFPESALEFANRAVTADRANLSYLDTVAHAAFELGRWREAADAWGVLITKGYFKTNADLSYANDEEDYKTAKKMLEHARPRTAR